MADRGEYQRICLQSCPTRPAPAGHLAERRAVSRGSGIGCGDQASSARDVLAPFQADRLVRPNTSRPDGELTESSRNSGPRERAAVCDPCRVPSKSHPLKRIRAVQAGPLRDALTREVEPYPIAVGVAPGDVQAGGRERGAGLFLVGGQRDDLRGAALRGGDGEDPRAGPDVRDPFPAQLTLGERTEALL